MGLVESAIRKHIHSGQRLSTPVKGEPFVVKSIDSDGIVLGLGAGEWRTRLTWQCLEGVVPYMQGKGWMRIGSTYSTDPSGDSLDAYLKKCVKRATAGWVAVVLETAGLVQ